MRTPRRARKLYELGDAHFSAGRYEQAVELSSRPTSDLCTGDGRCTRNATELDRQKRFALVSGAS